MDHSDDDYTIDVLKSAMERKVFTFLGIIGHVLRYVWNSTRTHEAMFSYYINYLSHFRCIYCEGGVNCTTSHIS